MLGHVNFLLIVLLHRLRSGGELHADHTTDNIVLLLELLVCRVVVEELVHGFESQAFSLGAQEPSPNTRYDRKSAEENEGAITDVLEHWRGDEADDEVEEPVGAGGDGHTLRTSARRVDLGGWSKGSIMFFQNREYNLRKAHGTGDQPMPKKNMKAIKRPTPAQAALW